MLVINNTSNDNGDNNTSELLYDQLYTFDSWYRGCLTRAVAHVHAVERLNRGNQILGLTTVFFTVLAGSSIFAGIKINEGLPTENQNLYWVAVAISLFVAFLTGVQTFFALPEKAQVHHQAFVDYQDLYKDMELYLHEYLEIHRDMKILNENMVKINERMEKIEDGRPNIKQKKYQKAVEHVGTIMPIRNKYSKLLRQRENLEKLEIKIKPEIKETK